MKNTSLDDPNTENDNFIHRLEMWIRIIIGVFPINNIHAERVPSYFWIWSVQGNDNRRRRSVIVSAIPLISLDLRLLDRCVQIVGNTFATTGGSNYQPINRGTIRDEWVGQLFGCKVFSQGSSDC